ncbi:hypothetical protein BDK51DRAFT_22915 [Blyttiomyces helicus]|uniref:Uncharacterized protein n=1 Tax=Blyttiomyces helicus TaxID=388810 RepID=A0A4P9VZA1_9FUNG|nr:hypothetical protein BDK51DRAFT_22915 [Blyttiomyces helicus]|eukprot:RKO84642.1 hypothetical protein BDK51DRAFT_22915 [Blyttiomyces helicus]
MKFTERFAGPCPVTHVLPCGVYRLKLPVSSRANDSFNTRLLKAYVPNTDDRFIHRA